MENDWKMELKYVYNEQKSIPLEPTSSKYQ
jgi:hypothetical protein